MMHAPSPATTSLIAFSPSRQPFLEAYGRRDWKERAVAAANHAPPAPDACQIVYTRTRLHKACREVPI
jgi:hypothetical protein